MGININNKFENHMEVSSPETLGDAKEIKNFEEEDLYEDLFSKKLDVAESYENLSVLSQESTELIDEFDTRTDIDDKVSERPKQDLPKLVQDTFSGGNYRTVETIEDLTLYRVYGGNAKREGSYLTTHIPVDRMDTKISSAVLQDWNSREYYCEVNIPKGTILNIGKVGNQHTLGNQLLKGGEDQILLPKDFPKENYIGEHELKFSGNYHEFEKKAKNLEQN